MLLVWTKHLKDDKEKIAFENSVYSSRDVLKRMLTIFKEEEDLLGRSEIDIKTFDQPNWNYRQAYKNGYRACLGMVSKLIDLDKQSQNN